MRFKPMMEPVYGRTYTQVCYAIIGASCTPIFHDCARRIDAVSGPKDLRLRMDIGRRYADLPSSLIARFHQSGHLIGATQQRCCLCNFAILKHTANCAAANSYSVHFLWRNHRQLETHLSAQLAQSVSRSPPRSRPSAKSGPTTILPDLRCFLSRATKSAAVSAANSSVNGWMMPMSIPSWPANSSRSSVVVSR
jgi:hypothetical protein